MIEGQCLVWYSQSLIRLNCDVCLRYETFPGYFYNEDSREDVNEEQHHALVMIFTHSEAPEGCRTKLK